MNIIIEERCLNAAQAAVLRAALITFKTTQARLIGDLEVPIEDKVAAQSGLNRVEEIIEYIERGSNAMPAV